MTSLRRTGGAIVLLFVLTVTGSGAAWADDLDPSDGDPGACPFYREPPHLRSPRGDGPGYGLTLFFRGEDPASDPAGPRGWIEHFAVLVAVGVAGGLAVRRRLT
jgi:MYXO-CTERM domain-containing protein